MKEETLNTKIFLTDEEFAGLFGPKIAALVAVLNETAREVCPPCHGWCCQNIHCLLYHPSFSTCPIFDMRPRECRYHFCNDVFSRAPLTSDEKDMMVQPVEELVCGNRGDVARLFFLFPEFPLDEKGLKAMGIEDDVQKIKADFEAGRLDQREAFKRLKFLCTK